jgi:hypothetical protein
MSRLESVYDQYQQRHIYDKLDEIAVTMEGTLLQKTLAEELFDVSLTIDSETKTVVREARDALESEQDRDGSQVVIDEATLEALEEAVEQQADSLTNEIHTHRVQLLSTVTAMKALNEEFGFVDADELADLATLLDDWDWRTRLDARADGDFASRLEAAATLAEEMKETLERAQTDIGAGFDGDDLETFIQRLLSGQQIPLAELSHEQHNALADSSLGDHLNISLG